MRSRAVKLRRDKVGIFWRPVWGGGSFAFGGFVDWLDGALDPIDPAVAQVSAGVLTLTPSVGAELITDGNFSAWTGDDLDNWIDPDSLPNASTTNANPGVHWLSDGTYIDIRQLNVLTRYDFYRVAATITSYTSGQLYPLYVSATAATAAGSFEWPAMAISTSAIFRVQGASDLVQGSASYKQISPIDRVALRNLGNDCNISVDITRTYAAGIIIAYTDTNNYAYINLEKDGAVYLVQCVTGTYTLIRSASITYSAGATLQVELLHPVALGAGAVRVWYDGAEVIYDAIDASLTGTYAGLFSTDSGNSFANLSMSAASYAALGISAVQVLDLMTTADAAPLDATRSAEPGPGTLTKIADTGDNVAIVAGDLEITGITNYGDPQYAWDGIVRAPGIALIFDVTIQRQMLLGLAENQSGGLGNHEVVFNVDATNTKMYRSSGGNPQIGSVLADGTRYQFAIVCAAGDMLDLLIKGGAYANWTLLYRQRAVTATVYPTINQHTALKSELHRIAVATFSTYAPTTTTTNPTADSPTALASALGVFEMLFAAASLGTPGQQIEMRLLLANGDYIAVNASNNAGTLQASVHKSISGAITSLVSATNAVDVSGLKLRQSAAGTFDAFWESSAAVPGPLGAQLTGQSNVAAITEIQAVQTHTATAVAGNSGKYVNVRGWATDIGTDVKAPYFNGTSAYVTPSAAGDLAASSGTIAVWLKAPWSTLGAANRYVFDVRNVTTAQLVLGCTTTLPGQIAYYYAPAGVWTALEATPVDATLYCALIQYGAGGHKARLNSTDVITGGVGGTITITDTRIGDRADASSALHLGNIIYYMMWSSDQWANRVAITTMESTHAAYVAKINALSPTTFIPLIEAGVVAATSVASTQQTGHADYSALDNV